MSYQIVNCSKGLEAIVDAEDYEKVSAYSWNADSGYARTFQRKKAKGNKLTSLSMHRVVMNVTDPEIIIDHINGNRLDNRKINLRVATVAQNAQNRKKVKGGSSIYLGVTYHKRDERWQAQVRHAGVRYYAGIYLTEEEAARAYDKKAKELHQEFARLNFPEE